MATKRGLTDKIKIKIGAVSEGKTATFTKDACSSTRDAAAKHAEKLRASTGKTARVIEDKVNGKFCVYVGPKAKPRGKK